MHTLLHLHLHTHTHHNLLLDKRSLRAALQPYGRLKHIKAYANSRTLVREIDFEGVEDMVTQEELRCPICGRSVVGRAILMPQAVCKLQNWLCAAAHSCDRSQRRNEEL